MIIEINFNSEEALYQQICHQIILGIASSRLKDGDALPSVRSMADEIGINMHTVNKAYSILRQQGYLQVDRRRGVIVSLSADKYAAMQELSAELQVTLAKARCSHISREEVYELVDMIYDSWERMD